MLSYNHGSPNDYYPYACHDVIDVGLITKPRGLETKELHPTTVLLSIPRERIITSHGRVLNLAFACAEVLQILQGTNDAQMLRWYNSKIVEIQGDLPGFVGDPLPKDWQNLVTRFNAGYGERLRGWDVRPGSPDVIANKIDQVDHVLKTLRQDPDSRQASIVISHPYFDHFSQTTKDRACNVYAHAMIRDNKLDWMQVMRSNDIVWGLPYNFFQWTHVQEWIAAELGVAVGTYFLVQDSLHVYENQYEECSRVEEFDLYRRIPKVQSMTPDYNSLRILNQIDFICRAGLLDSHWDEEYVRQCDPYWANFIYVFKSFAYYKTNRDQEALDEAKRAHEEFALPLLRFYLHWRWYSSKFRDQQYRAIDFLTKYMGVNEAIKWVGR